MNYSIRQTVGDTTVEISGVDVNETFSLFCAVEKHENEKRATPDTSHLTSLLRQVLDALETGTECP